MKKFLFLVMVAGFISWDKPTSKKPVTLFETSNGTQSASYHEGIQWWKSLASSTENVQIAEFGMTDAGYPLHVITLSKEGYSFDKIKDSHKTIILINNAIHPGEPDGVDASMMLFRDVAFGNKRVLDSCIVVCIPYYNIGGALNRNSHSRANQDGPEEYGFRGNAQNLDLNRDFVKCDSRNAESFAKLLQVIDPDMYIETHVSNGADYQYTMTYLATQPDKLGNSMGTYLRSTLIPEMNLKMTAKNQTMVPYVNHWGGPLKDNYATFYDSPRYSSGLTTLHNMYAFVTETHMLKPFKQRVEATYDFLRSAMEFCNENSASLKQTRAAQKAYIAQAKVLPIDWTLDKIRADKFTFKGYEYGYKKSDVTGEERLFYDTQKPIDKTMSYYGYMSPSSQKDKPKAYLLRRGFIDVEERLRWNGVSLQELQHDTVLKVLAYKMASYETVKSPYEKHYLHHTSKAVEDTVLWHFKKGDYLINTGTDKDRFILELLEPESPDSYFNWNFFDAILQQKEHYSDYVFEDKAASMLSVNSELRLAFEQKKQNEPQFAGDAEAQLEWIYAHSAHYEKEYNRLPVFKIY